MVYMVVYKIFLDKWLYGCIYCKCKRHCSRRFLRYSLMVMTFSLLENIVGSTPTIGFTSTARDLIRLLFGAVDE